MLGGGFRVGVSVTPVERVPAPQWLTPPGVIDRPSRLGGVLPVWRRADAEIAGDLHLDHVLPHAQDGPTDCT